jgi:hypothetical protein
MLLSFSGEVKSSDGSLIAALKSGFGWTENVFSEVER